MPYYRAVAHADAAAASTPERIGVLVVNLGTPDSPSYFAVQRYLRDFLGDRRVIETSRLIWLPILYGLVLPFRPLRTVRKYRKIWLQDGSPLAVYSKRPGGQNGRAIALGVGGSRAGRPRHDVRQSQHCRRHRSSGRTECEAAAGAASVPAILLIDDGLCFRSRRAAPCGVGAGCRKPASSTTTMTMRATSTRWRRASRSTGRKPASARICCSPITAYRRVYVKEGDPYQAQAEATTRLVVARLGLAADEWSHCYQSRFGSVVWLQPYTEDTLEALAKRGLRKLTVVSPSFAVDCLETLEEVAIEYRDRVPRARRRAIDPGARAQRR